jgi:putative tricarboxylic transport membrane protein
MSEGVGPAAQAQRSTDLAEAAQDVITAWVLIAVALVGPVFGFIFLKEPAPNAVLSNPLFTFLNDWMGIRVSSPMGLWILEVLRAGWYSLPLAAAGAAILVLGVRNPRDYYGGVALAALSLFALWASSDLPGMRGFAFGPGTAPRLFAYALLALGIAIALSGLFADGPPREQFALSGPLGGSVLLIALIPITYYSNRIGHLLPGISPDIIVAALGAVVVLALAFFMTNFVPRGPLFITAATLIFAVAVRPIGLVAASFVSLVVSAYATEEIRWVETLIWAAVLTAFCSLLFPYGLNLPLQLWPRF